MHSEEDFKNAFAPIEKELANHAGKSVILMTHNGPSESSTVFYQKDIGTPKILSGSFHLLEYLQRKESQANILVNIHGHTHLGHGRSTIGKVQIVNPGSLMENRFGVLHLKRDSKGKWYLAKTEHVFLQ
jgi:Icc-related predicted phosphoesterase